MSALPKLLRVGSTQCTKWYFSQNWI